MKRVLKVLGSIIGILLAIFLAAGIVVPKLTYETEVIVDRPIDTTFTLFSDETRIQEWLPTIKSFEHVSGEQGKPGAVTKYITQDQGREFEMTETLNEIIPNERILMTFEVEGMHKENTFLFSNEEGKTKITHQALAKGKGYIDRCMFAFFKAAFKKIDQGNLDSFKNFAEAN